MKHKVLSCLIFTLLTVFLIGSVSAALLVDPTSVTGSSQPSDDDTSRTVEYAFTLENTGSDQLIINFNQTNLGTIASDSWTLLNSDVLQPSQEKEYTATLTVPPYISTGSYNGKIEFLNSTNDKLGEVSIILNVNPLSKLKFTTTPDSLTKNDESTSIILKNIGNTQLNNIVLTAEEINDGNGNNINLTIDPTSLSLSAGELATVDISYDRLPSNFNIGVFSSTLTARSGSVSTTAEIELSNTFCESGEQGGDLEITRLKDKSSDDDWEWRPSDEIEIEVKVENNGDDDLDVVVEMALFDEDGDEVDVDFDEDEIEIDIDEDESETVTFMLELPSDIDEGNYRLFVKAYEDGDEEDQCTDIVDGDEFQEVDVEKEDNDVIIKDVDIQESSVKCGDDVPVKIKVSNVGKEDEDKVFINIFNSRLGIDIDSERFDLDEGDAETLNFDIKIPEDATENTYKIDFRTFFDYKKSSDTFREESDIFTRSITVECEGEQKSVLITASLESEEARAGQDVVIKAVLKNTGAAKTQYLLTISGYEGWAELKSVDPSVLVLEAEQSKEAKVTLKVNEDVSGEKLFKIRADYSGQTTDQEAAINIEDSSGLGGITGQAIRDAFSKNKFLWAVAILNIILVVIIIIVAVRIARS